MDRLFDWIMALMVIAIGIEIIIWPRAIEDSALKNILTIFSLDWLIKLYLISGIISVCALFANGRWLFWGPCVRAACALIRAAIWMQMMLALLTFHSPSPEIPIYGFLVVGEILSAFRAFRDAKR